VTALFLIPNAPLFCVDRISFLVGVWVASVMMNVVKGAVNAVRCDILSPFVTVLVAAVTYMYVFPFAAYCLLGRFPSEARVSASSSDCRNGGGVDFGISRVQCTYSAFLPYKSFLRKTNVYVLGYRINVCLMNNVKPLSLRHGYGCRTNDIIALPVRSLLPLLHYRTRALWTLPAFDSHPNEKVRLRKPELGGRDEKRHPLINR
jgi:hypothetical protein